MRSCERLAKNLSAFMDGELAGRKRRRLERHLADCPVCRQQLHQWRALYNLLEGPVQPAPPFFAARLRARLQESRSERRVLRWAPASAAVILGLAVGFLIGTGLQPPSAAEEGYGDVYVSALFNELPEGSLTAAYIELETNE